MIDIDYIRDNGLLLLEVVSGSQAYGLATPASDTDRKGVFYLPREYFLSHEYVPQVNDECNDVMYYELGKFIELLCRNNPNILEMLATPESCILYKHPVMNLLDPASFLSKLAMDTFAGYAGTQIRKAKGLNKKFNNPVPQERKTVLDFCYILREGSAMPFNTWLQLTGREAANCGLVKPDHTKGLFALYYNEEKRYKGIVKDENSNEVQCSVVEKGAEMTAYLFFNQEAYSVHCKNYREYWAWVEKRNESRYKGSQDHGKGYDAKNMMHTIRLLQVARELFETGELHVFRKNREELLAIKHGESTYDDLVLKADMLMDEIRALAAVSKLPDVPDVKNARRILLEIREKLYYNVTTN